MKKVPEDGVSLSSGSRACDRARVGRRMDTPGGCMSIVIPVLGFLKDIVLINSQERSGRVDLFLAVCLVVENHISRGAPEVRANRC